MLRRTAFVCLLGICFYQQWQIRQERALVKDLINGLQKDAEEMNKTVWDVPPPPNLPREWALQGLAHPLEQ